MTAYDAWIQQKDRENARDLADFEAKREALFAQGRELRGSDPFTLTRAQHELLQRVNAYDEREGNGLGR